MEFVFNAQTANTMIRFWKSAGPDAEPIKITTDWPTPVSVRKDSTLSTEFAQPAQSVSLTEPQQDHAFPFAEPIKSSTQRLWSVNVAPGSILSKEDVGSANLSLFMRPLSKIVFQSAKPIKFILSEKENVSANKTFI